MSKESSNEDQQVRKEVEKVVNQGLPITLVLYHLNQQVSDYLTIICDVVLTHLDRMDLAPAALKTAEALIHNGLVGNHKRLVFQRQGLNADNEQEYRQGMEVLEGPESREGPSAFKKEFKERNLPVTLTFYYNKNALKIKAKNNFPLEGPEEARIRSRLAETGDFSELFALFKEGGPKPDSLAAQAGSLLADIGVDLRCFTLYSSDEFKETATRVEIPISSDYSPARERFEIARRETNLSPEEFRKFFRG